MSGKAKTTNRLLPTAGRTIILSIVVVMALQNGWANPPHHPSVDVSGTWTSKAIQFQAPSEEESWTWQLTVNAVNNWCHIIGSQGPSLPNWQVQFYRNTGYFAVSAQIAPWREFQVKFTGKIQPCGDGGDPIIGDWEVLTKTDGDYFVLPTSSVVGVEGSVDLKAEDADGEPVSSTWGWEGPEGGSVTLQPCEHGTTVTVLSATLAGKYIITGTAGEQTDSAEVYFIKIELNNISGENEAGIAHVYGIITPTISIDSWETLVNGVEKQSGGEFTGGDFNFWIDQNWLSTGENTVTYKINIAGKTCSISFEAEKTPHTNGSNTQIVSAYFAAQGIGLRLYNHQVIVEGWHTITYSFPQTGRTKNVGTTSVKLFLGNDYGNVSWGEQHKYENPEGAYGQLMMSPPSEPYYGEPQTKYRQSSNNLWMPTSGLKGVSKVMSLIYDTGAGHIPAMPIYNRTIEVMIE